ncbi:uncharacterized protein LOC123979952 [Micropterus dolomieu]|uniref:uncharacterized protein LOC123979952 n=1 Tax=Micropterus dolomieu TaxID=147949 RepID=UPI001E8CCEDA|nr:uncharacterized protein LOC123979952 [Micropterus dolomieu]
MEVLKEVKKKCGEVIGCRVRGERTYEVTMKDEEGKTKLMNGLRVKGALVHARDIISTDMVVSFINLPVYMEDDKIVSRLNEWGVRQMSPIKRRMWPGTEIADGTRFLKVRFTEEVRSLPYSTKVETLRGTEYFRVIHDRQMRVCRLCIKPGHVFRDCPEFKCFRCKKTCPRLRRKDRGGQDRGAQRIRGTMERLCQNRGEEWMEEERREGSENETAVAQRPTAKRKAVGDRAGGDRNKGPRSGKPLQSGSPWRISAAAGKDVILPCRLTASVDPSPVLVVEWSRVDGPFPVTVHVLRNGEELVKEKAQEYLGRTAIMEDGSLKLLGVQRRDSGTYRCVLLRGSSVEEFVSLTVAEVAEVKISVRRTSANELFVVCESSGWSPEPVVSLLDAGGSVLAAQTESSVRPDDLHSVRALVNVAAVKAALTGSGTVICRVELPEMSLANENKIYISDEFDPFEPGLGCNFVMVFAIVLVAVVIAVMLFAFPVWMIEKLRSSLRSSLRRLTEFSFDLVTQQREGEPDERLLGGTAELLLQWRHSSFYLDFELYHL